MKDNLDTILFYLAVGIVYLFINRKKRKNAKDRDRAHHLQKEDTKSEKHFFPKKTEKTVSCYKNSVSQNNIYSKNRDEYKFGKKDDIIQNEESKQSYLDTILARTSLKDLIIFSEIINNPYKN